MGRGEQFVKLRAAREERMGIITQERETGRGVSGCKARFLAAVCAEGFYKRL